MNDIDSGQLTPEQELLKTDFIAERGYWNDYWNDVLRLSPRFFSAFTQFSSAPAKLGHVPPKTRELIYLALDASATHMFVPALRVHVRNALDLGVSATEIMEVLELCSVIGMHGTVFGVPILIDELRASGKTEALDKPLTKRQEDIRSEFQDRLGSWGGRWEALLQLAPEFLASFTEFAAGPWETGPLDPKIKDFIHIAINASATHMYEPALRSHVRGALKRGATAEELIEVLALVSPIGVHACIIGVPVLVEELAKPRR